MPGLLDVLTELIRAPGVSGYEDPVRDAILRLLGGELAARARVDGVGNLVLDLDGEGPAVLLAAHMDEIGLVVTRVRDDGLLAFRKVGGVLDEALPSTRVMVHTEQGPVPGVIGVVPPHLRQAEQGQQKPPTWREMAIDIGATSREEALEMGISPLDPVTLDKTPTLLAGGKALASRAIDDRMGCALLVELAHRIASGEARPRARVILAWTVQEEVGLRGAQALAHRFAPSLAVAVDTMACCQPEVTGEAVWGGGPVVRAIDRMHVTPHRLVKAVARLARERGIPVQLATAGGTTDAAAIQNTGTPSLALTAPVKYVHSTVELLNTVDAANLLELLTAIIEEPPTP